MFGAIQQVDTIYIQDINKSTNILNKWFCQ